MTTTMRAIVLEAPGPPDALEIRELPIPQPRPGWVLIRVKAFGLNRSELHTRLGLAEGVTFPRVLGIEATGIVAAAPGGEFAVGQQVVTMMGGMGRTLRRLCRVYLRACFPGHLISVRTGLGNIGRRSRNAPDGIRLAHGRSGYAARSIVADPRRHLIGRYGRRGVGKRARPDYPLHHPPARALRRAHGAWCRPRDRRRRRDCPKGARDRPGRRRA